MIKPLRAHTLLLTISSQIWPALIATLNSFSDGMQYSWSAPVLPILESPTSQIHIQKEDEFWLEASFLLAGLLGLPLSVYLTKTVGRRDTIFVGSIVAFVSWCTIAFTKNLKYLYLGRVLGGITGSMSYVATSTYLSEIARPDIRGLLISFDHLLSTIAMLFIYSVVPFCPFYVHAVTGATLGLVQMVTLPFIPRSPYHLLKNGKTEEAKNALRRLRNYHQNEEEFNDIVRAIELESVDSIHSFLNKRTRKLILLTTLLLCFQQFSGYVILHMNVITILKELSHDVVLSDEVLAIIFSCIVLLSTLVQTVTVDMFGGRKILLISSVSTGICSFSIAIYFTCTRLDFKDYVINWLVVAVFLLYAVFERVGLGYIPQILCAELFPTGIKSLGMAYEEFLYRSLGSLALAYYHYFGSNYGTNVPFFTFSIASFMSAVYTIFFVPETNGKSLRITQIIIK